MVRKNPGVLAIKARWVGAFVLQVLSLRWPEASSLQGAGLARTKVAAGTKLERPLGSAEAASDNNDKNNRKEKEEKQPQPP